MNNKLRPDELFVVIPAEWLDSMVEILETTPDAKAIYESIKPDDSEYWIKKEAKAKKEAAKKEPRRNAPTKQEDGFFTRIKKSTMKGSMKLMTKVQGSGQDIADEDLGLSMDWDEEAIALIRKAPKGIVPMAIHNVEEFAEANDEKIITRKVIVAQMEDAGMDPSLLDG